jgi:sulfoxide reductase heme-binding subunit YedZ
VTAWLKRGVFVIALVPAIALVVGAFTDDLGANPIEYITRETGSFALTFLIITLAVTPLRRLTGWHELIRLRRMLGLFAFFYASLHLLTWVVLDQFFAVPDMIEDVVKRPFITAGMATYLLLIPLALTSSAAMIRRLGGRRWQQLHRLTYLAAVGAIVHFWWLVKADVREPQRWALALSVLLGALLLDTLDAVRLPGVVRVVCHTPASATPELRALLPPDVGLAAQRGEDLGERMGGAFDDLLARGAAAVVLIGSDLPSLDSVLVTRALVILSERPDTVVLGPAADGGYYLIAATRTPEPLLTGVEWGTASVFAETAARARATGIRLEVLPEATDVDTMDDLRRVALASGGAARTRAWWTAQGN